MGEEARDILRCALSEEAEPTENLADGIRRIIEPMGGVELPPFRAVRCAIRPTSHDRSRHDALFAGAIRLS